MMWDLVQRLEGDLISLVFGCHSDLLDHFGELLRFKNIEGLRLSDLGLRLNWVVEEHFLLLSHSQILLQLLSVEPLDLLLVSDCFCQTYLLSLGLGLALKLSLWLALRLALSFHHLDFYSLLLIFFERLLRGKSYLFGLREDAVALFFSAEASTTTGLLCTTQSTLLLTHSPPSSKYFVLTFCSFGPFEFVGVCIDGLIGMIEDAGDSWCEIEVKRYLLEGWRVREKLILEDAVALLGLALRILHV